MARRGRSVYWEAFTQYVRGLDEKGVESIPDELLRRAAILARENQGLSLADAARLLGVTSTTLSRKVREFMSTVGGVEAGGGGGQKGKSGGGRGSPIPFTASMSDVELIESIVRAKLEQKYPIAYKLVKDTSWFVNVVLDMGIIATIFALKHADPASIDYGSPEKSVKQLTEVLERLAEKAARAEELEAELEKARAELEEARRALEEERSLRGRLEERLRRLEEGVERARRAIAELTSMVERLLDIIEGLAHTYTAAAGGEVVQAEV